MAGTGLRQVAARSLGMTAALRRAPQYAVKSSSSSLHCTLQFVASQFDRTIRMPNAEPGAMESLIVTALFGLVLLLASGMMAAQKATRSAA